jgi:beta-lactamase regulating signal transducer with metallopeptidase domain
MHSIATNVFFGILGWSLLHSIWQFAALLIFYKAIVVLFSIQKPAQLHALGLYVLITGCGTFFTTFLFQYFFLYPTAVSKPSTLPYLNNATAASSVLSTLINTVSPFIALSYLLMIAWLSVRFGWNIKKLQQQRNIPSLPIPEEWMQFVALMKDQLGIHKKIYIKLSYLLSTPQVIGYIKPIILIPLSCVSQLTPMQLEAILLHELAHIKRNDYWINIIINICGTLLFFNPFARRIIHQITSSREEACDDCVLQYQYPAEVYAKALYQLSISQKKYATLQIAASGHKKQLLLRRISRVLQAPVPKSSDRFTWFCVATVFIFFIVPFSANHFLPVPPQLSTSKGFTASLSKQENFSPSSTKKKSKPTAKTRGKEVIAPVLKTEKKKVVVINPNDEVASRLSLAALAEENTADEMMEVVAAASIQLDKDVTFLLPENSSSPSVLQPYNDEAMPLPFLPSNSLEHHYVVDSISKQAMAKIVRFTQQWVAAKNKWRDKGNETTLRRFKINNALQKKQAEALQQLIENKIQLAEGMQQQLKVIEKERLLLPIRRKKIVDL